MLALIASWFTPKVLFCLMNLVIATLYLSHKKPAPEPDPDHPLTRQPSLLQRVRSINFNPYNSDPTHNPSIIERVRSINFSFFDQDPTQDPAQTPSLLQRVRSINLSPFNTEHPDPTRSDRTGSKNSLNHRSDSNHVEPDPNFNTEQTNLARSDRAEPKNSLNNRYSSRHVEPDPNFSFYDQDQTQDPAQTPTENPSLLQRVRSIKQSCFKQEKTVPAQPFLSHHRSESEPVEHKNWRADPSFEDAVATPARMRKSSSVVMRPAKEEMEEVRRPATVREKKAAVFGEDEEVDEKADDFINKFKNQLKLQRLDSILRYKEMLNRGASR